MTEQEFRSELTAAGYECGEFEIAGGTHKNLHTHPWDARLLLLEGELTIETEREAHRMAVGGTCEVPANTRHAEITGPDVARGLIGKRAA